MLILHFALHLGEQMNSLLTNEPSMMSRLCIFRNYDDIVSDILSQVRANIATNRHLQKEIQQHSDRIASLERRVSTGIFSEAITSADSACSVTNEQMANLEKTTAKHELILEERRRTMNQANRDMGNARRLLDTIQDTTRRLERRIDSIQHTLALRNDAQVMRQRLPPSYDGHLVWKITKFSWLRNEAVNGQQRFFVSPCFFTSPRGYKMCARIYLNGNGMGRGTHISVFFVVMRGQYDAILRWPFRQKVTFMLLDQDNIEHVIDEFRPDPNNPSFQRPRREANIASGFPLFCSLTQLSRRAYVHEDTMFLRVSVSDVEDFVVQGL